MFPDRAEAGRVLGAQIAALVAGPAVVAAIPRGGVAVAAPIAERLGVPLTVVYARKLCVPLAPEFAVGAVDEDGHPLVDLEAVEALGLDARDLAAAQGRAAREIGRQMARYRMPPLARVIRPGMDVVLVDDGLATGLTMRAAAAFVRRHGAERVIVAVPCASGPAADWFRDDADRLVCPIVDEAFVSVAQYYDDFAPLGDDAVVKLLEGFRDPPERAPDLAAPSAGGRVPKGEPW
jgi:putative phosphoribosyl transferase